MWDAEPIERKVKRLESQVAYLMRMIEELLKRLPANE